MEQKVWWKSKTLWVNAIAVVLAIVQLATQTYPVDPRTQALVVGLLNILLRVLTGQPLAFRKPSR